MPAESYNVVEFLVACIENSTNGRPDWTKVGAACNIQKDAARMRYSSILKKNSVSKNGNSKNGNSKAAAEPKAKVAKAKVDKPKVKKGEGQTTIKPETPSPKKRKLDAEETGEEESDGQFSAQNTPAIPRPKRAMARPKKASYAESEDEEDRKPNGGFEELLVSEDEDLNEFFSA